MFEDRTDELFTAITESGFYPGVATVDVKRLLGRAPALAQLVLTEVRVDSDGLQMEAQVLAVAEDRLVFWGAYEQPGEEGKPPVLHSHARVFPTRNVADVRVMTSVSNPADFGPEDVPDAVRVVFVIDQLDRVEIEPLHCEDDDCGGGHGFHGEMIHDALVFYETREAVGEAKLVQLLDLAAVVSELIGRG